MLNRKYLEKCFLLNMYSEVPNGKLYTCIPDTFKLQVVNYQTVNTNSTKFI